jgi:hypothetical protein
MTRTFHFPVCLFALFVFIVHELPAQVPFHTIPDTAAWNKRKKAKIQCEYTLEEKYDSVTGQIAPGASRDTITYTRYDKSGREIEFCYFDDEGASHHTWSFYDKFGRLKRQLSTNADSTDGFEDRWIYGDGYQVVREEHLERKGSSSELYRYITFTYNSRGQLTLQWEYSVHENEEPRADQFTAFTYNAAGMEILRVTRDGAGDTMYVDSTFYRGNAKNYYQHRYVLNKSERDGKIKWVQRSYYAVTCDTANGLITNTYDQRFYDYQTGAEKQRSAVTLISNFAGNTIEARTENSVEKYSYNEKDEYLYTIVYNRSGQPI